MIRDRGVASRYAQALFGAAAARNELEAVQADLESLEKLYQQDLSLQHFLEAPNVLDEHKALLTRQVLGGRVSEIVVRFVVLLLEKRRVQHLPLVFAQFRRLVEQHLGLVRARVVTAVPLPPDQGKRLEDRLARLTGKKISLEARVDPEILGGAVVTLGDRIVDGSFRHHLEQLRDELLLARVY